MNSGDGSIRTLVGVRGDLLVGGIDARELLLFDRLAVWGLNLVADFATDDQRSPDQRAAIEWLTQKDFIFEPAPDVAVDLSQERLQAGGRNPHVIGRHFFEAAAPAIARIVAAEMCARGTNAVSAAEWTPVPEYPVTRAEVIQLIVNDMPIPGGDVSLEDAFAFREEARSQGLVQSLRVWIDRMASGALTAIEVADTLEDLVSRYERALTLEKMSRDAGVVETLVVTTGEIAESLVKFRWSTLAKKLFEVRHRQVDLMKAEMTLPGREVAYIVHARRWFRTQ